MLLGFARYVTRSTTKNLLQNGPNKYEKLASLHKNSIVFLLYFDYSKECTLYVERRNEINFDRV